MTSSDEDAAIMNADTVSMSDESTADEAQVCESETGEGSPDAEEDPDEAEEAARGDSDEEMPQAAAPRAPKKPSEKQLALLRQAHQAAFMRNVLFADGGVLRLPAMTEANRRQLAASGESLLGIYATFFTFSEESATKFHDAVRLQKLIYAERTWHPEPCYKPGNGKKGCGCNAGGFRGNIRLGVSRDLRLLESAVDKDKLLPVWRDKETREVTGVWRCPEPARGRPGGTRARWRPLALTPTCRPAQLLFGRPCSSSSGNARGRRRRARPRRRRSGRARRARPRRRLPARRRAPPRRRSRRSRRTSTRRCPRSSRGSGARDPSSPTAIGTKGRVLSRRLRRSCRSRRPPSASVPSMPSAR